jgi:RNA:NAD 2'-phosphotransferase (TPT1/KptA family)
MIFYHGTSKENWQSIQQEGLLWGIRNTPSRCTYLASDLQEAVKYGEIILQIDYEPSAKEYCNNWCEGCWQHREYEPIQLSNIIVFDKH